MRPMPAAGHGPLLESPVKEEIQFGKEYTGPETRSTRRYTRSCPANRRTAPYESGRHRR